MEIRQSIISSAEHTYHESTRYQKTYNAIFVVKPMPGMNFKHLLSQSPFEASNETGK